MHLSMRINPQNNSSNSRGDGAQEGTGHGGLKLDLNGHLKFSLKAIEDAQ